MTTEAAPRVLVVEDDDMIANPLLRTLQREGYAVERVDHGVRSIEDVALVRRLAADGTPLTMCPLSNLRLQVVSDLAEHPLPRLLDAGVRVTVNSDDPAYFGGYVADNYLAVAETFAMSESEVAALAGASLEAAFVD